MVNFSTGKLLPLGCMSLWSYLTPNGERGDGFTHSKTLKGRKEERKNNTMVDHL